MKIVINKQIITINDANTFIKRFLGLMGKKNIKKGMLFRNCHSIHTFFMKENIDLIMLNNNYEVVYYQEYLQKNKIIFKKNAKHTIELPKGLIKLYKIKLHEKIDIIE